MRNKNFISNVYLDKFINTIKKNKNYKEKPETYFSYFEKEIIEKREIKEIKELVEGLIISGMLHYTDKNGIFEVYSDNGKTDTVYSIKLVQNLKNSAMKIGKFEDFDVIKYSKENNLDFAIITDAVNWRIYNLKEINYYDNYIEIDITSYLSKQEFSDDILFLCEFIDVNNFFRENKEDTREINKIFSDSAKEIETLEKNIKSVIEPILTDISNGFINSIGKTNFNDKERREIYIDSIVLLYRILFVLYAESRELFPTTSEAYQEASLTYLIEEGKKLFETEELIDVENDFTLYDKFDKLVNWIDGGGQEIGITAYNGGLFRNSDKPILRNYKLKNRYFAEVILKLGYLENKNGNYTDKIDYRDLTVRNLGTFYEGILEYNLFIAEEELVKRSEKGKVEFIPISETTVKRTEQGNIIKKGEVYLSQDKGERKETGAYYTPEPIVEYIVSNTVDKKLEELKSKIIEDIEKIDSEIKNAISDRDIRILNRSKLDLILEFINNKVLKLSVLDNAMGSGHFLVNAALHISNFIMELVYENLNFEIENEEYEEIGNYNYWKRMVITHCIYGVDINELAVQLGKLSLWLVSASKDKPLSFLDHHLKCGNSLLGTRKKDIETTLESGSKIYKTLFDTTLNTLVGKLNKIYGELSQMPEDTAEEVHMKEEKYDEIVEELEVVKAKFDLYLNMQIEDKKGEVEKGLFEDIAKSSIWDIRSREIHKFKERMKFAKENKFFHWELEFPEVFRGDNGGFDCIIGNPPYIKEYVNKEIFEPLKNSIYYQGKMDLWYFFPCISLDILKKHGLFGIIAPNNWISNSGASKLRNKILTDSKVLEFIDFGDYKVFRNADIQTMILIFEKSLKNDKYSLEYSQLLSHKIDSYQLFKFLKKEMKNNSKYFKSIIDKTNLYNRNIEFYNNYIFKIINKIIEKGSFNLKEEEVAQGIVPNPDVIGTRNIDKISSDKIRKYDIRIGDGVFVVKKDYFKNLTYDEKSVIKPLYEPNNFQKYILKEKNEKEIIYIIDEIDIVNYPNIIEHLDKYKEIMEDRRENKKGYREYYQLHWGRDISFFGKGEKIISLRKCPDFPVFSYTNDEVFVMLAFNIIKTNRISLKYLSSFFNSKIVAFWLKFKGKMQGSNYQIDKEPLLNIPIPKLENKLETRIEEIVNEIMELKKQNKDTQHLEDQIDQMVYKIYDLTEEEIAIVEEAVK